MLTHLEHEELVAALDAVVADILDRAEVAAPPIDALVVARRLGIVIARDDRQSGRARCVRLGDSAGQSTILLRSEPRAERQQWAVAHELGEHQAAEVFRRLGVVPGEAAADAREQVANWLANRLLLPAEWFASAGCQQDWDLRQLKRRFTTASHELIARRMLDFGPPAVIAVIDQRKITWRRGSLGGRLPTWSPCEKRGWEKAHRTSRDSEVVEHPWRVRAWAVHEPDWRREIVRLECVAGYDWDDS